MQQEIQLNYPIIKRFAALEQKGRLAHAYLFTGPSDIGKGETALAIAKLINCESRKEEMFCGVCPFCIKIDSGNHPDVYTIDNGYGESIKIEQVRELLSRNKLRAFMARKKVFIIKNIENMTLEGANAFLKTLEEPAADSLLLLTTSVPEKNLDTIKSRCHMIHFPPVSGNNLAGQLSKDHDVDEVSAHFLAYFAQGCPGAARKLKDDCFIEKRNGMIDRFILNRPDDSFIKEISSDKEQAKAFLDILLSWIRDAFLMKTGVEDGRLIHLDRMDDVSRFQVKYTFEELKNLNESVVKMCQLLADNLNIKLPLLIIGEQLWER